MPRLDSSNEFLFSGGHRFSSALSKGSNRHPAYGPGDTGSPTVETLAGNWHIVGSGTVTTSIPGDTFTISGGLAAEEPGGRS